METKDCLVLENHNKVVHSAEEALDFNFNESDDTDSNESVCASCRLCIDYLCTVFIYPSSHLGKAYTDSQASPFLHFFGRALREADLIVVEGTVKKYAIGFKIDLCTDDNRIAFHVNPRLDQNYIARNTWIEGRWGSEEGCSTTRSPIQRGLPFQFQIYVLEREFLVAINGVHMFNYQHRIPLTEIVRIEVFGDVLSTVVYLTKSCAYPHELKEKFRKPNNDLTLPLIRQLKYGLGTFGKITIQGRIKLLPVSFSINIEDSDQVSPHPKVIYHFNPRYAVDGGKIIENSWGMRGAGWDEEVRSPLPAQLFPGSSFTLWLTTNSTYIQTGGQGWALKPFYHRLSPDRGMYLRIQGDVVITSLNIQPDQELLPDF